jgi:hypothetical protein
MTLKVSLERIMLEEKMLRIDRGAEKKRWWRVEVFELHRILAGRLVQAPLGKAVRNLGEVSPDLR